MTLGDPLSMLRAMVSTDSLAARLQGRRFGLVLSAGYFGFFAHAGMVAALEGAGLHPAGFAGTSAGALVAALAAGGFDAERIGMLLRKVRKSDFWDPAPIKGILDAARGRGFTGLLAGHRFRKLLDDSLPVKRIEDTPHPLVIVTTDVAGARKRLHVEGSLAEAVHASCAYPGLFRTVDVGQSQLWDGGLVDKAPLLALAERVELDALLVHYLPSNASRGSEGVRRHGYLGAMARALAASRHEGFELQARLCEARGLPVYVVAPQLPRLGPGKLSQGSDAVALATAWAARSLNSPQELCRPFAS